tara:strand:+ start:434 stop:586 length:153 start_codon:yes stop_codon:yes gene_type:complete
MGRELAASIAGICRVIRCVELSLEFLQGLDLTFVSIFSERVFDDDAPEDF